LAAAKNTGVTVKKGQEFGHFNLGSTIVILFEAPADFKFVVEPGMKIKYGQALGDSVARIRRSKSGESGAVQRGKSLIQ